MNYPPRLGHLATRKIVASKLGPTYAQAHNVEEGEAISSLERALAGDLWEGLLTHAWASLTGKHLRLDEQKLLEKIAGALSDRPYRPGRVAKVTPSFSAFLIQLDLAAGTASDMARRVLESPEGARRAEEGLREAGEHLAQELVRK